MMLGHSKRKKMRFLLQILNRMEIKLKIPNLLCLLFAFLVIAIFAQATDSEKDRENPARVIELSLDSESKASKLKSMTTCLERLNKPDAEPSLNARELKIMLDSKIWEVKSADQTKLQRICNEVSEKVRDITLDKYSISVISAQKSDLRSGLLIMDL